MYTFDHDLFSALNFDGGTAMDRVMLTVSGTAMWLPLYALILWLVWRRSGWRGMLIFTALMLAAIGLADMVSGIFKSNGVLGGLLPGFEPRWRPMFTPSLEGLDITPDSLRVMRREAVLRHWVVHVPPEAVSGMYGTVSAHAATIVALAVLAVQLGAGWHENLLIVKNCFYHACGGGRNRVFGGMFPAEGDPAAVATQLLYFRSVEIPARVLFRHLVE